MKNPIIMEAVKLMIPKYSIHVYYPSKEEAQRESYQSGLPWFMSVINGEILYSVRTKTNYHA